MVPKNLSWSITNFVCFHVKQVPFKRFVGMITALHHVIVNLLWCVSHRVRHLYGIRNRAKNEVIFVEDARLNKLEAKIADSSGTIEASVWEFAMTHAFIAKNASAIATVVTAIKNAELFKTSFTINDIGVVSPITESFVLDHFLFFECKRSVEKQSKNRFVSRTNRRCLQNSKLQETIRNNQQYRKNAAYITALHLQCASRVQCLSFSSSSRILCTSTARVQASLLVVGHGKISLGRVCQ